jgi:curved DNA-binding protein CbpA
MQHIALYLKEVYFKKKRGRLSFHHQNFQKYLFFQDGFLIHAKTNHPLELLGEVLFRMGKLSKEDFDKIDEYIEPRKSIGSVLLERGLVSKESLREGLIYQMREIVLNMFSVFDAELKFQEDVDFSEEDFDVKLKLPVLIEEGIRRMKHHPALETFLADKTPVPKSIDFYLRMTEQERELLDKVKGKLTAGELLSSSEFMPETYWKSLYFLYCLDLVDLKGVKLPLDQKIQPREGEEKEKVREETEEEKIEAGQEEEEKKEDIEEEEQPKAEEKIEEVMEFYEKLASLNYYQILGIADEASSEDAKKSYFQLARKFHPDLFSRELPSETKKKIDSLFSHITKAYQTLSDQTKKDEYNGRLDEPATEDKRRNLAKEAEKRFRQGKFLFNQARYEEALVFLEQAVRLYREKASYFLLLAMTQAKLHVYRKEAEKNFIRALKLEPWNAEVYAALGLLYKKEGLLIKAKKQFEKALQIDPDHRIARRELLRDKKDAGKKSFKEMTFKDLLKMDLFGKKKK